MFLVFVIGVLVGFMIASFTLEGTYNKERAHLIEENDDLRAMFNEYHL